MFCRLIQLPTGRWHCPVCDPTARRTLPLAARRHCGPPQSPEAVAEQMLAVALARCREDGVAGASEPEIRRRLDHCRRCEHFTGANCRRYLDRGCQRWLWALVQHVGQSTEPCERWK